ncbi:MAG: DUF2156 domain-containing protein [ANME-2 cluster archaeon]|jgi:lysylphosphatidylglycerol synthetase-like protein (DUF2156 family)|nr:MAG: DUF2156 domain-containing protein [ANME-2 cluster archaeon]
MEKEQVKLLLKKYAYNTVSFQSLMEGLDYFESSKGIEGVIPYLQIKDVCLAVGDPICAQENFIEFVHEFRIFNKNNNADLCFLSASEVAKHYLELMACRHISKF